jgi:hypothetical protein
MHALLPCAHKVPLHMHVLYWRQRFFHHAEFKLIWKDTRQQNTQESRQPGEIQTIPKPGFAFSTCLEFAYSLMNCMQKMVYFTGLLHWLIWLISIMKVFLLCAHLSAIWQQTYACKNMSDCIMWGCLFTVNRIQWMVEPCVIWFQSYVIWFLHHSFEQLQNVFWILLAQRAHMAQNTDLRRFTWTCTGSYQVMDIYMYLYMHTCVHIQYDHTHIPGILHAHSRCI